MSENTEKFTNLSNSLPSKVGALRAIKEYIQSILGIPEDLSQSIQDAICKTREKSEEIQNSAK